MLPGNTSEIWARWSASDNESGLAGCDIQLDSGTVVPKGMDMRHLFVALSNGTHVLKVHARDKAGNTGTAEAVFSIGEQFSDGTPPQIKITKPQNNQVRNDKKLAAAWTGYDAESGIQGYFLKLDDGPWTFVGPETSRMMNITANGRHSLTLRALDNQGNIAEDTVSFNLEPKTTRGSNTLLTASILVLMVIITIVVCAVYLVRRKRTQEPD
jgi:hypothetical protein